MFAVTETRREPLNFLEAVNTWHTSVGPITCLTATQWVESRLLN